MDTLGSSLVGQTVFISYSSVDRAIAEELSQILRRQGVSYFLDQKDVGWGDSVTGKIRDGLADCSALIAVLSPGSIRSQWVPFEIGHAIGCGKVVLPYLTHPAIEVPGYLRDLHFVVSPNQVESYFADPLSKGLNKATLDRFGSFSGQYMGLTWALDDSGVLLEEIRCRQVATRLDGTILGVAVMRRGRHDKQYSEIEANRARYAFKGFVDERLFVISYQSSLPTQISAGALALMGDSTGLVFSGRWTGLVEDSIETSLCRWIKLTPSVDVAGDRSQFLAKANEYLTDQSSGLELGVGLLSHFQSLAGTKTVLVGKGAIGKTGLGDWLKRQSQSERGAGGPAGPSEAD